MNVALIKHDTFESLKYNIPNFENFCEIARQFNAQKAKYLLFLYAHLYSNFSDDIENFELQVEHILPKQWQNANFNGWDKETHAQYLNQIGNKILLPKASNIKCLENFFAKKQEEYKKCENLTEVRDLGERTNHSWLQEYIQNRNREIYQRLKSFIDTNMPISPQKGKTQQKRKESIKKEKKQTQQNSDDDFPFIDNSNDSSDVYNQNEKKESNNMKKRIQEKAKNQKKSRREQENERLDETLEFLIGDLNNKSTTFFDEHFGSFVCDQSLSQSKQSNQMSSTASSDTRQSKPTPSVKEISSLNLNSGRDRIGIFGSSDSEDSLNNDGDEQNSVIDDIETLLSVTDFITLFDLQKYKRSQLKQYFIYSVAVTTSSYRTFSGSLWSPKIDEQLVTHANFSIVNYLQSLSNIDITEVPLTSDIFIPFKKSIDFLFSFGASDFGAPFMNEIIVSSASLSMG